MIEKEWQIQCEKDAIATTSKVELGSSSSGSDTDSAIQTQHVIMIKPQALCKRQAFQNDAEQPGMF